MWERGSWALPTPTRRRTQQRDWAGAVSQTRCVRSLVPPFPVCSSPAPCNPVAEGELLKPFSNFLYTRLSTVNTSHRLWFLTQRRLRPLPLPSSLFSIRTSATSHLPASQPGRPPGLDNLPIPHAPPPLPPEGLVLTRGSLAPSAHSGWRTLTNTAQSSSLHSLKRSHSFLLIRG